jgi:parallel beta-helix repeat protein
MKTRRVLVILTFLLLLAAFSPLLSKAFSATGYVDVTVVQAKTMIDTGPSLVVLDVRNESEYVTGHIRNAKLIPLFQLSVNLSELNVADEILVYCKSGARSTSASQILAANGFLHIYNMAGGITGWEVEGYPTYVDYGSIQQAVNNATEASTLYVGSGQYFETLTINKSLSLVGENWDSTIIDGNGNSTVLYVNADNFCISDFKIQYSGCSCEGFYGIDMGSNRRNVNITHNNIFSDSVGIFMKNAEDIAIVNNNVTSSRDYSMVLQDSTGILVSDNIFANNLNQVDIENSSGSAIVDNNLTNNGNGITLTNSNDNMIMGNMFSSNQLYGIFLSQSNNNSIFDNSFQTNWSNVSVRNSTSFWDNGLEGNFWSNYTGTDRDKDGIGDTPLIIDTQNVDNHPLIGTFSSYLVSLDNRVDVVTNSTINNLEYVSPSTIRLQVSNATANQTVGFCRIGIPHALIDPNNGTIQIIIDNNQTQVVYLNTTVYDNGTYRWMYFAYPQSTHEIIIVPEYSLLWIIPLFLVTIVVMLNCNRKRRIGKENAHKTT